MWKDFNQVLCMYAIVLGRFHKVQQSIYHSQHRQTLDSFGKWQKWQSQHRDVMLLTL